MLIGIVVLFEAVGWSIRGTSFLFNAQRLLVMVLQVSIIGLLAIGVTQVILTGGIDLSSGSVVALVRDDRGQPGADGERARRVSPRSSICPSSFPSPRVSQRARWPGLSTGG